MFLMESQRALCEARTEALNKIWIHFSVLSFDNL